MNDLPERAVLFRRLPAPSLRRALRQNAGLTLRDLAGWVGCSRAAISYYELGQRTPRGDLLRRYVEALDDLRAS